MDIDMSATRQQMLETAEHLNQQMTDGIPFTWETLEQALTSDSKLATDDFSFYTSGMRADDWPH